MAAVKEVEIDGRVADKLCSHLLTVSSVGDVERNRKTHALLQAIYSCFDGSHVSDEVRVTSSLPHYLALCGMEFGKMLKGRLTVNWRLHNDSLHKLSEAFIGYASKRGGMQVGNDEETEDLLSLLYVISVYFREHPVPLVDLSSAFLYHLAVCVDVLAVHVTRIREEIVWREHNDLLNKVSDAFARSIVILIKDGHFKPYEERLEVSIPVWVWQERRTKREKGQTPDPVYFCGDLFLPGWFVKEISTVS